jgi:hypothetical protein
MFALAACSAGPRAGSLAPVVVERLFFGRAIADTGMVSDSAWSVFLREVVTPRFPDGLTVWPASGQWRAADGRVVHEPSVVVEIVHAPGAAADASVAAIIAEYRRRFRQEAVLRLVTPSRASF